MTEFSVWTWIMGVDSVLSFVMNWDFFKTKRTEEDGDQRIPSSDTKIKFCSVFSILLSTSQWWLHDKSDKHGNPET